MSTDSKLSARVAAELRAELARQRLTGRDLARRVELPPTTVARWLRNETTMNLDEAEALASALGLRLPELLDRADGAAAVAAVAAVPERDLPHRRPASGGRRDLRGSVNERYLAAIIHGSERRSTRDDWRIRELRGSHELPILARRHGHNLRICRKVAA
jgi:transcriptional regulator with XRE-family HTH domain